jgi:hypothetical protein
MRKKIIFLLGNFVNPNFVMSLLKNIAIKIKIRNICLFMD